MSIYPSADQLAAHWKELHTTLGTPEGEDGLSHAKRVMAELRELRSRPTPPAVEMPDKWAVSGVDKNGVANSRPMMFADDVLAALAKAGIPVKGQP